MSESGVASILSLSGIMMPWSEFEVPGDELHTGCET